MGGTIDIQELTLRDIINEYVTQHDLHRMKLEPVLQHVIATRVRLATAHPAWSNETDIRLTTFGKLQMALQSARIGLLSTVHSYGKAKWWPSVNLGDLDASAQLKYIEGHDLTTKISLFQLTFSSVENCIRMIMRQIGDTPCQARNYAFKCLYDRLYNTELGGRVGEATVRLDLLREVRNTIHNNGVYINKRGLDVTVTVGGHAFEFRHGQPVNFVTWDFLMGRIEDLMNLLEETMNDAVVYAIPAITDPLYRL